MAKHQGANGVEVVRAIRAEIEDLKGVLIPDNVHIEYTRDYGRSASDKVNSLFRDLLIATVEAIAMLDGPTEEAVRAIVPDLPCDVRKGLVVLDLPADRDREGLAALRARMAADLAPYSAVQAQAFRSSLGRFSGEDEPPPAP